MEEKKEIRKKLVELLEPYMVLSNYDITTVFNFIKSIYTEEKLFKIIIGYPDNKITIINTFKYEGGVECNIFEIPNKPLHLYTKQEEKELYNKLRDLI